MSSLQRSSDCEGSRGYGWKKPRTRATDKADKRRSWRDNSGLAAITDREFYNNNRTIFNRFGYEHLQEASVCAHEAALLFLAQDVIDKLNISTDETSEEAVSLMKLFDTNREATPHADADDSVQTQTAQLLDIEPLLNANGIGQDLSFTIRIIGEKDYKVSNIADFIRCAYHNQPKTFGKYTYQLGRQYFNAHGQQMYDLLVNIAEEKERAQHSYVGGRVDHSFYQINYSSSYDKAAVDLYGHYLDDFYDICAASGKVKFDDGKKTVARLLPEYEVCDDQLKPVIEIAPLQDASGRDVGIRLKGNLPQTFRGQRYSYLLQEGRFSRIIEETGVRSPLEDIAQGGRFEASIGLRQLSHFYYDTLPQLRRYADVQIADKAQEIMTRFLLPAPEFTFYLDREDEHLVTCKAVVSYGESHAEDVESIQELGADDIQKDSEASTSTDVKQDSPQSRRGDKRARSRFKWNLLSESTEFASIRDTTAEQRVVSVVDRYFSFQDTKLGLFVIDEDEDDDKVYELLRVGLSELADLGTVNHTAAFLAVNVREHAKFDIDVNMKSNLLDLEISADGMSPEELLDILHSYRSKKKYYRLKSGDYLSLGGDEIGNLDAMLADLHVSDKDLVAGNLEIPGYRALYLDKMLEKGSGIYAHRDKYFRKLISQFKTIGDAEYDLPTTINAKLRGYQEDGYQWMRTLADYGFGGILADEMGLGKTLQVITVLEAARGEQRGGMLESTGREEGSTDLDSARTSKASLVVVPASLVYNWGEELRRFAPDLKVMLIAGTKAERTGQIARCQDVDVVVTSYDLLKRDIAYYEDISFAWEIIDEAQYIKNYASQAAKSVKLIKADHKLALTGTPIENRLSELWSIFDYLMPGILYSHEKFKSEYETPIADGDERKMERLRAMVAPFLLRRKKADVLADLPDKIEEIRYAHMSDKQRKIYDGQVVKMLKKLQKSSDADIKRQKIEILAELTRIRQICCDPSLCFEDYREGSCKTDACMELIESCIEGEHKTLVFSQFVTMLEILKGRLDEAGIAYYEITGSTPKQERVRLVDAFNGDATPVFLISLKAGGTGLNLTGADVVIHYDPWWNVAAQNQATDRAHRIGQKNVVTVYKLIASGTIEDRIIELQEKKRQLAEGVLESESAASAAISREDLMQLLG